MRDLFDTEEKKKEAINSFQSLITTDGWKKLKEVFELNIEELKNQLSSGVYRDEPDSRRLREEDRIRDKIAIFSEVCSKPEDICRDLFPQSEVVINNDPYYSEEELEKSKNS